MNRTWMLVPLAVIGSAIALLATREPAPTEVRDISGVKRLVVAAPFTTSAPFVHYWQAEQPLVNHGWLCVVEADAQLCTAKQTVEPVLIAGAGPVERVNHGTLGRTVVLVPCTQALAVDGRCASTCNAEALQAWWWLAPTLPQVLPEQLDSATIAGARLQLPEGAVRMLTAAEVAAALKLGGDSIHVANETELHRVAAAWILEHAPEDRDVAQGLLAPPVR